MRQGCQFPISSLFNASTAYLEKTKELLPKIVPDNPKMKKEVQECINEFVEQIVGEVHANKITGSLLHQPIEKIKEYLNDYENFKLRVLEAAEVFEVIHDYVGEKFKVEEKVKLKKKVTQILDKKEKAD